MMILSVNATTVAVVGMLKMRDVAVLVYAGNGEREGGGAVD